MTIAETIHEIETLKDVLVAFEEGASDERYSAKVALRNLVKQKQKQVEEMDAYFDEG